MYSTFGANKPFVIIDRQVDQETLFAFRFIRGFLLSKYKI